ncbi:MAG: DUF4129 domain-containing protein [Desulfobacteraceae bacterium]
MINKGRLFGLRLAAMGMDFVWMAAAAGFALEVTAEQSLPFFFLGGVFVSGAVLGGFISNRDFLRIVKLGAYLAGAAAAVYLAARFWAPQGGWSSEFASGSGDLGGPEGAFRSHAAGGVIVFCSALFWLRGIGTGRMPIDRRSLCNRFDGGLAALMVVFLIGLLGRFKGAQGLEWGGAVPLFLIFISVGLPALSAGPTGRTGGRRHGPERIWVTALFGVLIGLLGAGIVRVLMPVLVMGADAVYELLKTTSSPVGSVFLSLIKFMFGPRRGGPEETARSSGPGDEGGFLQGLEVGGAWGFERVLGWILIGLLGIALAMAAYVVVMRILKFLFSRSSKIPGLPSAERRGIVEILFRAVRFLVGLRPLAILRGLADPGPVRIYNRMSSWSKLLGIGSRENETAGEFGQRLVRAFPGLSREVRLIIDLANKEAFSGSSPDSGERESAFAAWRRLRSPRNWRWYFVFMFRRRPVHGGGGL